MATFQKEVKHDFDLEVVYDSLTKCARADGCLDLVEYLAAYRELCRFFKLTGRLFGFVANDLEYKISSIQIKQTGKNGQHYQTVQAMVLFEVNNSLARSKSSGSRTLLMLHWVFEFILEFMSRLRQGGDDDKTSVIASEVYAKTLSKHHPWITRKMATLAMHFLPTRKDLISVMCKQDHETVLQLLKQVVQAGKYVFDATEKVFSEYELLNIP